MDASKLYRTQLFITKLFGLLLDYRNDRRGNSMKLYAFFVLVSSVFSLAIMLHFIVFGKPSVEEFSDAFACIYAESETTLKLILFYKWRHKFKKLFSDMGRILNSGNSLSRSNFEKIVKFGEKLTWIYLLPAILTTYSYIFGALYKMYVKSERFFPFKVR